MKALSALSAPLGWPQQWPETKKITSLLSSLILTLSMGKRMFAGFKPVKIIWNDDLDGAWGAGTKVGQSSVFLNSLRAYNIVFF